MSSPQVPLRPPGFSKASVRWRFFLCAVTMMTILVATNLCLGKTWSDAVKLGIGAGFPGVASWIAYHCVSRRENGFAFIIGNSYSVVFVDKPSDAWLGLALILTSIGVVIGLIFGWTSRTKQTDAGVTIGEGGQDG